MSEADSPDTPETPDTPDTPDTRDSSETDAPRVPAAPIALCAWCGTPISTRAPDRGPVPEDASGDRGKTTVTHGICTLCIVDLGVYPIESLMDFDRGKFDDLPFGIVEVDADGRVVTYNRWEEELAGLDRGDVLGRNFFSEVAPCTGVAEFEGKFRELVAGGKPGREQLEFMFRFPGNTTLVSVALTWAPAWERGFILVRRVRS